MCVGKTLNIDSCSKFWGNLEGIWGNPGEIPHIGWSIGHMLPPMLEDVRFKKYPTCAMSLIFLVMSHLSPIPGCLPIFEDQFKTLLRHLKTDFSGI